MAKPGSPNEIGELSVGIVAPTDSLEASMEDAKKTVKSAAEDMEVKTRGIADSFSKMATGVTGAMQKSVRAITSAVASVSAAIGVYTLFFNIGRKVGEMLFGVTKASASAAPIVDLLAQKIERAAKAAEDLGKVPPLQLAIDKTAIDEIDKQLAALDRALGELKRKGFTDAALEPAVSKQNELLADRQNLVERVVAVTGRLNEELRAERDLVEAIAQADIDRAKAASERAATDARRTSNVAGAKAEADALTVAQLDGVAQVDEQERQNLDRLAKLRAQHDDDESRRAFDRLEMLHKRQAELDRAAIEWKDRLEWLTWKKRHEDQVAAQLKANQQIAEDFQRRLSSAFGEASGNFEQSIDDAMGRVVVAIENLGDLLTQRMRR